MIQSCRVMRSMKKKKKEKEKRPSRDGLYKKEECTI